MGRYLEAWNLFLTICGLSCVENKVQGKDGTIRYEVSRWKYTIPLTIICALCLIEYYLAVGIAFTEIDKGKPMVSGYLNETGNAVAALIIISAVISSSGYASVKMRFTQFDEMITIDYKTLIRSILKYAAFFFTVYIFSFITDFLVFYNDRNVVAGLKMLSSYIFQSYNILSILHFSVCLFWLRKSFALINADLEKQAKLLGAWSKKQGAHKLFHQSIVHPDYSFDFLKIRAHDDGTRGGSTVERLRFLRTLYHAAYELTRDVNSVFSTRNVVIVGYNFVVGTIFMYSGISEVVKWTSGNSGATGLELLLHFKESFISFLSIYGLVWPCTSTCDEARKTAAIMHGLLTQSMNEELRAELQSTSFQFIHEQVSFSPHGFFSLNNNLLLSIMGAVVSYLVVLIQFQISMT